MGFRVYFHFSFRNADLDLPKMFVLFWSPVKSRGIWRIKKLNHFLAFMTNNTTFIRTKPLPTPQKILPLHSFVSFSTLLWKLRLDQELDDQTYPQINKNIKHMKRYEVIKYLQNIWSFDCFILVHDSRLSRVAEETKSMSKVARGQLASEASWWGT